MELKKIVKLDLRKKIVLSISSFLLFIFLVVYFIIFPSVRDIKNIRDEIETQRVDLERRYVKGQSLRKLSEKLEKAEEKIHILDQVFIDQEDGLEFITTLEGIAGKNNINQKINLLQTADNNGYSQMVPLQIFPQGEFSQILNYLVGLETLNYYINIKTMDLSSNARTASPGEEKFSGSVGLFITADTYWRNSEGN
jgi:Tfp pilus assembly protein PilO